MSKNPIVDKLRSEIRELKAKVKATVADIPEELVLLRGENQKLRRRAASNKGIADYVQATLATALEENPLVIRIPKTPVLKPKRADEPCIALAHVTDLQCGKLTPTYSSEICEIRMMEYAEKVAKAIHRRNADRGIDTLHVYWGGDMVEGELIFPHQAHQIDSSVFEQATITVPRILTRQVCYWLQTFKKIKVFAVAGNHGRPASKHAGSHPQTNWDSVAYACANLMIQNALLTNGIDASRVEVVLAESWYVIDEALGHKNMLVHGDQGIRGFGGFPWYGVARKMAGWIDAVPEDWRNLYFGHFHQFASADFNGRRWYCGGTPESDNEWARSELAASGRPQQRLQILTSSQVVCDLPIYLNEHYRPNQPKPKR